MLSASQVDALLIVPGILGLVWSAKEWVAVSKVKLVGPDGLASKGDAGTEKILEEMRIISKTISEGAIDFLFTEYTYMGLYIIVFGAILCFFTGKETTCAFVIGAITSILCGYIGMKIAVYTNVRTTHECWSTMAKGYKVAIQGGSVMGLSLVSLGLLALVAIIKIFHAVFHFESQETMYEAIAGYGLGGSSIALFGRVGGGIYTKAADVGADLSGKNEYGLEEDDYRNPACIADNVGDNVGDIAGMGADLFGSFAEATCAALVLAAGSELKEEPASLMYPVLVSSTGIVVGIVTLLICSCFFKIKELGEDKKGKSVENGLKGILVVSTALMSPVVIWLSKACLPVSFKMGDQVVQSWHCALAINLGLWSGLLIGFVTEYYTSGSYNPVKEIAHSQIQSAATGIIYGLALGYLSCIIPVLCLGITVLVAHTFCGMFGVALGALGMLGTMTMALTIDAYGPISDNAGGIAEMSGLPEEVRAKTDCLDAAGNTTAAIGKGFAIGSAALVSLALFAAFCQRAEVDSVDVLNPWVFTGLLFGAMIPYAFAAMTMKSVGKAANEMYEECMIQFPKIMAPEGSPQHEPPNYKKCIKISTEASLKEMIAPGLLVIASPLVAGIGFGKNACAGLLSGALVSSVQLAISMSNTGGAWDNSKKFISAGLLVDPKTNKTHAKGSDAHKNSVTGDTVGDPLKDTSGPALNIVMKLTAILSLVFGSAIKKYSNEEGGPCWL